MDDIGFWSALFLLVTALVGTLLLETFLGNNFAVELYVILALLVMGLVALIGIASARSWAWSTATVVFVALIINAAIMFITLQQLFAVFATVVLVAITGVLLSLRMADLPKVSFPVLPKSVVFSAKKKK